MSTVYDEEMPMEPDFIGSNIDILDEDYKQIGETELFPSSENLFPDSEELLNKSPVEDEIIVDGEIGLEEELEYETQLEHASEELTDVNPLFDNSYKLNRIPISRVRNLLKIDPTISKTSQEAITLIARAAELFVTKITQEAFKVSVASKRRTLKLKDLDDAVQNIDCLLFLDGELEDEQLK